LRSTGAIWDIKKDHLEHEFVSQTTPLGFAFRGDAGVRGEGGGDTEDVKPHLQHLNNNTSTTTTPQQQHLNNNNNNNNNTKNTFRVCL